MVSLNLSLDRKEYAHALNATIINIRQLISFSQRSLIIFTSTKYGMILSILATDELSALV